MELRDFEKLAKQKLTDSSEAVDTSALLKELNLDDNNSGFFSWSSLFVGTILIVLFAGGFYVGNRASDQKESTSHKDLSQIKIAFDQETPSANAPLVNLEETKEIISTKQVLAENKKLRESGINPNVQLNSEKLNVSDNGIDPNQYQKNSNPRQSVNDHVNISKTKISTDVENVHVSEFNQSTSAKSIVAKNRISLSELAHIDPIGLSDIEAEDRTIIELGANNKTQLACPEFGSEKWRLAIIPEIGYEQNIKSLSSADVELQDILALRQDNESTLEGYQFALYLKGEHRSGIYIKGGASYSRFTERLSLQRTFTELDTTIGVVSVTKNQNCDTLTTIFGEIVTETEVSENRRIHYNLSSIDIPLAVGYGFNAGVINFDLELGAMFNLQTSSSGRLFTEINDLESLENNNRFERTLGLGFFGSVLVRRELQNGSAVYIGPRFEYRPNDYSTQFNPFRQRYNAIGLYAAYVHRF